MTKIFVWLSTQNGPVAQIWSEIPKDNNEKPKYKPLFERKLSEFELELSLNDLISKYPKPEEKGVEKSE